MMLLLLLGLATTTLRPVSPSVPVAPPPVLVAPPAPSSPPAPSAPRIIAPADQTSEAEALAFVQAYSPSSLRRENELRILRRDFIPTLQKNPDTAAMLKAFPALGPAMIEALAANIDIYMTEYDARFLPRAVAIVRECLTRDETGQLTAYYRSPVGQRAMRAASNHIDASEVAQAGLEGREIDTGIAQRQVATAGWAALADLSAEDRAAVIAMVLSPAGKSFRVMAPRMAALQTELVNSPGPEFKARSERAMGEAFQRITGMPLGEK